MPGAGGGAARIAAHTLVAVGLASAYAWWAVSLTPFSAGATAAVVGAGGTAVALGSLQTLAPRSVGSHRLAPWAVLGVALAAWQVAAYAEHPRRDHPTLSSLTNELLDSHPARAAAFVAWLAAAVQLGRR